MTDVNKPLDASGRGLTGNFRVPFPGVMYPYNEQEIAAVVEAMRNAKSLTQGPYLQKFEQDFQNYSGAPHAFAVDNATNALRLAATLCRLGPGDEVIIPAYTFCATAIPFGGTGAKIVWADIDPDTRVACPADIERKITPRTKAIVVVHLLGMPVDMDPVMAIANAHNLKVVEDCAQAPGAAYKGKKVGTIGDYGCYSFHGAKNMTTLGEGGMLTVQSDADAALVPGIRHNGVRAHPASRPRYWVPAMSNVDIDIEGVWPNNFCIGEVQCALGSTLLKRLDCVNNILRSQADRLMKGMADIPEISFQKVPEGHYHVYHVLIGKLDTATFGCTREDFMDIMTGEFGLRMIVQYYPLYRYPLFQKMGFAEHDCPQLEAYWDSSFSWPWWCGMPDGTLNELIDCTHKAIDRLKGE